MTSHAITRPRLSTPTLPVTDTTALVMLAPSTYKHDMSIIRLRDRVTFTARAARRTAYRAYDAVYEWAATHQDENIITGAIIAMALVSVAAVVIFT